MVRRDISNKKFLQANVHLINRSSYFLRTYRAINSLHLQSKYISNKCILYVVYIIIQKESFLSSGCSHPKIS